ncbi:MAG TPA: chemotaxis protein CheB, partial [Bryobacteraceae bacterium]
RPGTVYIAPANYHLLVEKDSLALSTESPVGWARPSIDVLFESAADAWGERVIGVILTGANSDGSLGLARIKEAGGLTIAQDPSEAEFPVMPRAAMAASRIDHVLTLVDISALLARLCPDLSR